MPTHAKGRRFVCFRQNSTRWPCTVVAQLNYKFQLTGNPLSLDFRPQKSASSMTSFELYTLFFSVILE